MTKNLENICDIFPTEEDSIVFLENILWSNTPKCPYCKTSFYSKIRETKRYYCNKCNASFSVTVGTMFHKTKVDLRKWFYLINSLSSGHKIPLRELAIELDITKDTASRIIKSIQKTFVTENNLIHDILNIINNGKKTT